MDTQTQLSNLKTKSLKILPRNTSTVSNSIEKTKNDAPNFNKELSKEYSLKFCQH